VASQPLANPGLIRFGEDFELDARAYELRSGGIPLKLKPMPMELLFFLVERRGELVTRDQIVERIWGKGVFLDTDNSINGAISKIRQVLRDDADEPRYIQTVSGKGYRFVALVQSAPSTPEAQAMPAPPAAENMVGKRISHYRILHLLGGGGMGLVYKAEDLKLGRQVALKFLPAELASDPLGFARLEREARAASALDHPNICSIHQLGDYEGQPFIVMQLLEGQTLRDWIEITASASTDLRVQQLLDLGCQIADGLEAAHGKNIIHRDIKPANIFITTRGQAKILDFGVAKFEDSGEPRTAPGPGEIASLEKEMPVRDASLTRTGLSVGTPSYFSPEQARGEKLDARTDLFSFGLVLHEMATGRQAFPGKTVTVVREAVLNDPAPTLRQINPGLPEELERIVSKALEKDRELRYQGATELRNDLQCLKESRGISKTPAAKHGVPASGQWLRIVVPAACAVAILLLAAHFYFPRHPRLSDRDTIVLADFANTTGDSVFDGGLKRGLAMQIEQSPFLKVLSDQKVSEILHRMGRPETQAVTADIGREICLRAGSNALLGGTISRLGSHYLIDLNAFACASGEPVAHEQAEAASKEQVLQTLGRASSKLRAQLGESLPSVQKFDLPLEVTTSSLEALKNYSLCIAIRREKGDTASIPFCKRAIELDPDFPLAYSALATSYLNLEQPSLATQFATKAYALRDRVSEHERLQITADYFGVTGDLVREARTYEQWVVEYPRDDQPLTNLAVDYSSLGQYEKSLAETQKALQLSPDDLDIYQNLAGTYISLNRLEDAQRAIDQSLVQHRDGMFLHTDVYFLAFLRGGAEKMQEQLTWAAGEPGDQDVLLAGQGDTEAFYGRMAKARDFARQAMGVAQRSGAKESAALWQVGAALRDAEVGNDAAARGAAVAALAGSSGRDVKIAGALTLARIGDSARAEALAKQLAKDYPANTMLQVYGLPCLRAAIALRQGRSSEALADLEAAQPYDLSNPPPPLAGTLYPAYLRGQAYLLAHNGTAAAAEFQKLLDHQGLVLNFVLGALAHLQIGRAYVLTGDNLKAQAAYQAFFALWKDADPGIPLLKQAKSEYARLAPIAASH
jgi:eukaryotic-like serine/threonine-protein kinase